MTPSEQKTPTPRTDLAIYQKSQQGQTVMADFARSLEAELAAQTAEVERLRADARTLLGIANQYAECAALRGREDVTRQINHIVSKIKA